ncbi:MAG: hypothetical protein ABIV50_01320 [Opitutus sp.]
MVVVRFSVTDVLLRACVVAASGNTRVGGFQDGATVKKHGGEFRLRVDALPDFTAT